MAKTRGGGGAPTVAALLGDNLAVTGETIVPVLSGSNLDIAMFGAILVYELTARSPLLCLRVQIKDGPGKLNDLSRMIADHEANIRTVQQYCSDTELGVSEVFVVFLVETSGTEHAVSITETIEKRNTRSNE